MVDWERVRLVRVGMCESEAERVLGARLQYYHHPVNAIVFTTHPQYGRIEVAFRLSAQKCITDVSYKERYRDRAAYPPLQTDRRIGRFATSRTGR